MKRVFQFRISTMLAVTAACAFLVYFFLPFSPNVVFFTPEMSFYNVSEYTGVGYPQVSVELKNNGRSSIWYLGSPGCVNEFSTEGDAALGEGVKQVLGIQHLDWICLAPGQTASVTIPSYMLFETAKLEVEFQDWRGRAAICESQEFDFSSVPVGGASGKGVHTPTALIPQGDSDSGF